MVTQWMMLFFSVGIPWVPQQDTRLFFSQTKPRQWLKLSENEKCILGEKKKKTTRFLCVRLTTENFPLIAKKKQIYECHEASKRSTWFLWDTLISWDTAIFQCIDLPYDCIFPISDDNLIDLQSIILRTMCLQYTLIFIQAL